MYLSQVHTPILIFPENSGGRPGITVIWVCRRNLNSGGSQYTRWERGPYTNRRGTSAEGIWGASSAEISGTSGDTLYLERYGDFSYPIPLPNGNYTVDLRFAGIYWSYGSQRVLMFFIEGMEIISSLDVFALVGKNAACVVSIPATVSDGKLDIRFSTIMDNAKVSAIIITNTGSSPLDPVDGARPLPASRNGVRTLRNTAVCNTI